MTPEERRSRPRTLRRGPDPIPAGSHRVWGSSSPRLHLPAPAGPPTAHARWRAAHPPPPPPPPPRGARDDGFEPACDVVRLPPDPFAQEVAPPQDSRQAVLRRAHPRFGDHIDPLRIDERLNARHRVAVGLSKMPSHGKERLSRRMGELRIVGDVRLPLDGLYLGVVQLRRTARLSVHGNLLWLPSIVAHMARQRNRIASTNGGRRHRRRGRRGSSVWCRHMTAPQQA